MDLLTRKVRRGGPPVQLSTHRVRAARLPAAPPRAGALARADPQLGVGLRARSRDERRRRLHRLPAPQARQRRRTRRRSSPCAPSATASAARAERCARPLRAPRRGRAALALAGWVALVSLICTGIAFVAVYRGTGTQLRHQIDQELAGDAASSRTACSAAIRTHAERQLAASQPLCPRPAVRASSTLLFALVPGAGHEHQSPRAVQRRARPTTARARPSRLRRTDCRAGC